MQLPSELNASRLAKFGIALLIALLAFIVMLTVKAAKEYSYIGYDAAVEKNTIAVRGEGEAFAVPDVATFSYSVIETGATVAEAQKLATKKINDTLAAVRALGVEDKDLRQTDYNVYPKYEYRQSSVACRDGYCPPSGRQVLTGYEVSSTVEVKVRNVDKAGEILTKIGSTGVSNVSGLTMTVDQPKTIEAEARSKAIADAKARAEKLAADLGVRIVRVAGFSESGNYPYPMYAKTGAMDARGAAVENQAAELPKGQNKFTSQVDIVYEIR